MLTNSFIEWGLADKPTKIITPNVIEIFAYGIEGKRYMRTQADSAQNLIGKTFYFAGAEYRLDPDDADNNYLFVYVGSGSYSPLAAVKLQGSTHEHQYFLRDHLGSNLITVNDVGETVGNVSHGRHDPWGLPWRPDGVSRDMREDSRGFTGHEIVASAEFIHMNARVYDAKHGMFLSPDQYIQKADTTSVNPYVYTRNSPLNATDPTGWMPTNWLLEMGDMPTIRRRLAAQRIERAYRAFSRRAALRRTAEGIVAHAEVAGMESETQAVGERIEKIHKSSRGVRFDHNYELNEYETSNPLRRYRKSKDRISGRVKEFKWQEDVPRFVADYSEESARLARERADAPLPEAIFADTDETRMDAITKDHTFDQWRRLKRKNKSAMMKKLNPGDTP